MAITGKNIEVAAMCIRDEKLVAIPTETVYGLAANALSENAVMKVFEAKKRPFFDPLIIHVHSIDAVGKYAHLNDPALQKLAAAFWPGPLTLLLPKKNNIPDLVTSGLDRVAVRIPAHPQCLQLLSLLDLPLAAPSANPFGYVSPTTPEHVHKQLGREVDYILDGGTCEVGIESTIVGEEDGHLCVYRLGGLSIEELERFAGKMILRINSSSDPAAPGQLKSHYAPLKPLFTGNVQSLLKKHEGKKIALISFGQTDLLTPVHKECNLSPEGSVLEAARRLFACLREADESDADLVIAAVVPDEGLGKAINDRIRRAAA